jgi:phytoene/squalene synthetase
MSHIHRLNFSAHEQQQLRSLIYGTTSSFTLLLKQLEYPLNYLVATGYLVLRAAGDLQDCKAPYALKQERFREFERLLRHSSSITDSLRYFEEESSPGLTAHKTMLLTPKALDLWQCLHRLPPEVKEPLLHQAQIMLRGLVRFSDPEGEPFVPYEELCILHKEADFNAYCAAVAGTGAHFFTWAAIDFYNIEPTLAATLADEADIFGRALHKVRLIRDFPDDIARGRCFFPYEWMQQTGEYPFQLQGAGSRWNCTVVESAWEELKQAVSFIRFLPPSALNYKTFCLAAVVPAYYFLKYALQYQHKLFSSSRISLPWPLKARAAREARSLAAEDATFDHYFREFDKKLEGALAKQTSAPLMVSTANKKWL